MIFISKAGLTPLLKMEARAFTFIWKRILSAFIITKRIFGDVATWPSIIDLLKYKSIIFLESQLACLLKSDKNSDSNDV